MSDPVNISELKNHLSAYLRRVRAGETLLVCDRDRVVARIEPAGGVGTSTGDESALAELERRGVLRRGTGHLPVDWRQRRIQTQADVVGAVLAEREEGR